MKRMKLIILYLAFTIPAQAPMTTVIDIQEKSSIQPYEKIWQAVCKIESSNNPKAYRMDDNGYPSVGIVQIQQSRLNDFKKHTGINYTLEDMYSPEKSKIVFLFYACEFQPYDVETISRCWNAGPRGITMKCTKKYYFKIKKAL